MLKKLSKYIKQYKTATILTVLFTVGEVIFEVAIPYMIGAIIDKGISAGNSNEVLKYGFFMILMAICALFCGIMSGKYAAYSSTGFAANLRLAVFEKVQKFSFANIDKFSTGGLITRITTDVNNIQNAYMMSFRMLMRSPITLISSLFLIISISPKLSTIFFVAGIAFAVTLVVLILPAFKLYEKAFNKYDDINSKIQENVKGIRVVKSFVKEDSEIQKFLGSITELYNLFIKAEVKVMALIPIVSLTLYICMLALSWFGARMVVANELTTGELTSLFSYITNVIISLLMVAITLVGIVLSEANAKRVIEVLDEKIDLTNPLNGITKVKDGSILFENVDFSYRKGSNKYALSNINLDIKSGQTIGIIGGTGSSKTSLANLISRLYDVENGSVKVGGIDVREYDLEVLRDSVSMVLQKNELFSGTILENLRWGDKNATLEDCKRVCKIACADEFIEKFEDKYDTYIEQGGSNVSGGQKQRLCIARALLKKPKIIIFDDSTSAVDTATDAKIRLALREYVPEITKIIIAQRLSSVKDADKIIVLDDGKVDGFDTHENLLKNNKIYKAVAEVQMESSGDFDRMGE